MASKLSEHYVSSELTLCQAMRQSTSNMNQFVIRRMESVDQTRKRKLKLLANEYGSVAKLAEALERSSSQVSQWLNSSLNSRTKKPRTISNDSARYIEEKLNLPRGWLDSEESTEKSDGTPIARQFYRALEQLQDSISPRPTPEFPKREATALDILNSFERALNEEGLRLGDVIEDVPGLMRRIDDKLSAVRSRDLFTPNTGGPDGFTATKWDEKPEIPGMSKDSAEKKKA